jgi:4-hydroxy-3-polyprenylbenzoate decarboxylase
MTDISALIPHPSSLRRLIVGISGASGVIYGIRLLQVVQLGGEIETHLVLSAAARATIAQETSWKISEVEALAAAVHNPSDIGASIASGSFLTMGMVIVPCSIKTLSAVATCYSADLMSRAADVCLKEGRPLILCVRETPLHVGHLRLMTQAAESGAIIMPPIPALYGNPSTLDEVIDGTIGRILLRLGIDNELYTQWKGMKSEK